jgi:hypothetical protein
VGLVAVIPVLNFSVFVWAITPLLPASKLKPRAAVKNLEVNDAVIKKEEMNEDLTKNNAGNQGR